jgi:hypothetical protein
VNFLAISHTSEAVTKGPHRSGTAKGLDDYLFKGGLGMRKGVTSLLFVAAVLALASSEASAMNFLCQAVGPRSVAYGAPSLPLMPSGRPFSGANGTAEFASSAIAFRRIDYCLKPAPGNAAAPIVTSRAQVTGEAAKRPDRALISTGGERCPCVSRTAE